MKDLTNLYAVEWDLLFQLVVIEGGYMDLMQAFLYNPQMGKDIKIWRLLLLNLFVEGDNW